MLKDKFPSFVLQENMNSEDWSYPQLQPLSVLNHQYSLRYNTRSYLGIVIIFPSFILWIEETFHLIMLLLKTFFLKCIIQWKKPHVSRCKLNAVWSWKETSPLDRLVHNCLLKGFLPLPLKHLVKNTVRARILRKLEHWFVPTVISACEWRILQYFARYYSNSLFVPASLEAKYQQKSCLKNSSFLMINDFNLSWFCSYINELHNCMVNLKAKK